jgi:hypothetical protein
VLPLEWVVAPADHLPFALRIKHGGVLVRTARETRAVDKQGLEETRAAEEAAQIRVKELEEELRRRYR